MKAFYEDPLKTLDISLDLSERPCRVDPIVHHNLVERLANFFRKMIEDQHEVKDIWKPAGEWKDYIDERAFFYDALKQNDLRVAEEFLRNFWRNPLGMIVKEYARFEALQGGDDKVWDPFIHSIGRNYLIWRDLFKLPVTRLQLREEIGNPWGCKIENVLVTPKAVRFHTNAMELHSLLEACQGSVVGEIGAGYGALCHYLMKENSGIRYVDLDLPETVVLAAYYILLNFPDKSIFLYGEDSFDNFHSWQDRYDIFLLPNYAIELAPDKFFDVAFNSFSLSEMPMNPIKAYLNQLHRLTKRYFLHDNMDRKGVINRGFERIPASEYPINPNQFSLLSKGYDLFHAHFGDYKKFLYTVKD